MIETVTLKRELDVRDIPRLGGDHWHSSSSPGVESFHLRKGPGKPDGISCTVRRIGGQGSISVQATLPTLVYRDPAAKIGTLEPDLLMYGVERALSFVRMMFPHVSIEHHSWSVSRWDSSVTYDVGAPHDTAVLDAAHRLALLQSGRNSPVHRIDSDGMTITRGRRGSATFDRVYLKGPEARKAFPDVPDGLLRAERENTPKAPARPRLKEFALIAKGQAETDVEDLARWMMDACATLQLIAADSFLIGQERLGEKKNPGEAMRLAGIMTVLASFGIQGLLERGYSRASAYRLRARIEQLQAAVTDDDISLRMVDFMDDALKAWSKDMLRYGVSS